MWSSLYNVVINIPKVIAIILNKKITIIVKLIEKHKHTLTLRHKITQYALKNHNLLNI